MDLRRKHVGRDAISPYVLAMLVLAGLAVVLVLPLSRSQAGPAGTCPTVPATQKYTFLWGQVTINATPAPPGSVVEARNPRGDTVGCQVIENPGEYPLMYVYGEETVAGTPIPGMRTGEVIAFAVERQPATPSPVPTWTNNWQSHQVDLSATSAVCPYDFNDPPGVDVGDITLIASAWRNTDAVSLDDYDFNGNNIVDIGDIQTVAAHWGDSCS